MKTLTLILTAAVALTLPLPLLAVTLYVANDGKDVSLCGTKSEPCRTISQAISNSNRGDTVLVGPGLYGDIDQDGELDREGEESALNTDHAMIAITSPIKLVSRDGAASTIIHVEDDKKFAISIESSDVQIGAKKKGFTIRGGSTSALFIRGSSPTLISNYIYSDFGDGVRVGCYDSNDDGFDESFGFSESGTVVDNIISHCNGMGLLLCSNTQGWKIKKNQVSFNDEEGIFIDGDDHTLLKNVVSGNNDAGVVATSATGIKFTKSLSIGNRGSGLNVYTDGQATVKFSALIGNTGIGSFYNGDVNISKSSLFGNYPIDNTGLAIPTNCGIFDNSSNDPMIENNYWGSPDGPDFEDPADDLCSQVKTPSVTKFLKKEKRVRPVRPAQ